MISILGVPYDGGSSFLKGCRFGPSAIRKALNCNSTNAFAENEIKVVGHASVEDAGDIQFENVDDVRITIETHGQQSIEFRSPSDIARR